MTKGDLQYASTQFTAEMWLFCCTAKGRRQPKAVKPKKMIRLESKHIVYAACNNGSSAVITKDGALYMFGKDTAHCHQSTGKLLSNNDFSLVIYFCRVISCFLVCLQNSARHNTLFCRYRSSHMNARATG